MEFKSFDSMEAMQDFMRTSEMEAMEHLSEHQQALLPKERFWWVRPVPEMRLVVFGYFDLAWLIETEKSLAGLDDPFTEREERHIRHMALERGYKKGRAYSVIEPVGELGDTHVANMWEISEAAFLEAKEVGWDIPKRMAECPTLRTEVFAHIERENPGA